MLQVLDRVLRCVRICSKLFLLVLQFHLHNVEFALCPTSPLFASLLPSTLYLLSHFPSYPFSSILPPSLTDSFTTSLYSFLLVSFEGAIWQTLLIAIFYSDISYSSYYSMKKSFSLSSPPLPNLILVITSSVLISCTPSDPSSFHPLLDLVNILDCWMLVVSAS